MNPLMNRPSVQNQNPLQMLGQFMRDPVGALRQAGYTVPDGMSDPRQIANYLVNNGQITNSKLAQLQKMAQMLPKSR